MMKQMIKEASAFIRKQMGHQQPKIGFVLGSGLGVLGDDIENCVTIRYEDIPHFPTSTVSGHAGQLIIGQLAGKQVIAMKGRFHYYEGYSLSEVTFPIRVMKQLGVETMIITNAAGGINEQFNPGDLMIITDHINLMGTNPLIGPNDSNIGDRFLDMTEAYDREYICLAEQCAKQLNINVKKGVYVGNTGPTYETPAEINMLRTIGGDAVGMSTVPEVIVSRHVRLRVLGISCISNMAAGILDQPLTHEEVIETTVAVREDFLNFVKKIVAQLPEHTK